MSQQPQTPYNQTYGNQAPQQVAPQPASSCNTPGQPAPPYDAPTPPPYPSYAPEPSKGKATAALICGILAIFLAWVPFAGIVLGIVGIVLAGSYIKGGGTAGTAKAGRVCGVVGLVFSVIMFALTLLLVLGVVEEYDDYEDYVRHDYSYTAPDLTAEEQLASKVVTAKLDKIKNADPAMMEEIAKLGEAGFKEMTGLTMEQCGVDSAEYAKVMTEDFSYTISIVLADHDYDDEGFVSANVDCRDRWEVYDDFYEEYNSRSVQKELAGLDESAFKKRIGELFMQAARNADRDEDLYFSVDIDYIDGSWVLDQQSWDEEIYYLFGL